jgi:uncharacterized protein YgiM (DUF1202 family)
MKPNRLLVLSLLLVLAPGAFAETAYVTERLRVALRAEPAPDAAIVKNVDTGDALAVLERRDAYARVRDPAGVEGWVDARLLSAQPTAAAQLKAARAELAQLRQQLSEGRAGQPGVAGDVAKLQGELEAAKAQIAALQQAQPNPEAGVPQANDGGFSWLWLGIAFAMLVLGFIGGVLWVRESIRRRMGGMYLRI